jgi:hypothetical protein
MLHCGVYAGFCLLCLWQFKPKGLSLNCEKLREIVLFGHLGTLEFKRMNTTPPRTVSRTEYVIPSDTPVMIQRSASLKVQRRRQRLIALYNTVKHFTTGKAAEALVVSRWTVERDLTFLREHDLLTPRRSKMAPFEPLESGSEFMQRFNQAHRA